MMKSIAIAFVATLTGLWQSERHFGNAIDGGEIRIAPERGGFVSTIGNYHAVGTLDASGATHFRFSEGSELVVRMSRESFAGQWIQPQTISNGEGYASPVSFARSQLGSWRGEVRPVADAEHFYLYVRQLSDGSVGAFLRNPESNAGASIGERTVIVNGSEVRLRAAGGDPDLVGSYDAQRRELAFQFEGYPGSFVFHPVPKMKATGSAARPLGSSYVYTRPAENGDGWRTASLADVGLNEAMVDNLVTEIVNTPAAVAAPYVHGIQIARHGKLVLDEYFYGFDAQTTHDVRSAGKSITTLMVGTAMHDSPALRTDTPVYSLFPQYPAFNAFDARKQRMKVADLMTMSSGLACDDNDEHSPGSEDRMQMPGDPDWYKFTLDLPTIDDPGAQARYCSAGINLLGAVITHATGAWLPDYFYDRFAHPMQFGRYALPMMPPPMSTAYMAGGGQFLPRDFLKFGQLFLDNGKWNGQTIVDPAWLAASVVPRSGLNNPGDYGYGWHISSFTVGGRTYPAFNAGGNGGQLLFVIPKLDMTVMITAGNYGQYRVWRTLQTEPFVKYLIPAATN